MRGQLLLLELSDELDGLDARAVVFVVAVAVGVVAAVVDAEAAGVLVAVVSAAVVAVTSVACVVSLVAGVAAVVVAVACADAVEGGAVADM
jgi:hypothetical protein